MWTTRLTQATAGKAYNVILARDDLTFLIGLDDWWTMSATEYLANKALEENNLNFKISELYGAPRSRQPIWTTDLVANGDSYDVHLLGNGAPVAVFTLDEFAKLSATSFAVEDAVEVAGGLAPYGRNIKEVDEHFEDEFGDHEEHEIDDGPVRGPWESPRKR
jgi:hypothetical protein